MSDAEISVFEGHYQDRYRKHSGSVQAFDTDAQAAFENADVLPSTVPRETLGMPADQHEILSQNRAYTQQMRIDNPKIKINEDGTHEVVPGAEGMEPLPARMVDESGEELPKSYNDLSFTEQTQVQKMNMLEGLRRKRNERTIIDPDQIFEPDTGMNRSLKVVAEIGEGFVEGLENTARSAAILGYEMFPPTNPFGAAMAEIMNSPAISTTDLRAGLLPDIKDQEGLGYGLVRGFAQFVPNFIAFNRALSGFTALKTAHTSRGFLAGMPADALAFDAVDGNLHDIAVMAGEVDVPGLGMINLDNEYTQFMSASSQDTQAEGRFRNVIEGGLIGAAFEATLKGLGKGYTKAQQSAMRTKFVELYVGTAKNVRDFRNKAAGQLETNAMQALKEAREGKLQEGDIIEMHGGGLPVTESQSKKVKAFSEIALAKIMKGEVTDLESWKKTIKTASFCNVCDRLRKTDEGEEKWQKMMESKKDIAEDEFLENVDISEKNILDEGETWEEYRGSAGEDMKFYEADDEYFFQTAGFEFIWDKPIDSNLSESTLKKAFDNATEYMDAHNPAMQGRRAKQQEIDIDQGKIEE